MASAPPWPVAPCSPRALCTARRTPHHATPPHLLPLRLVDKRWGHGTPCSACPADFCWFSLASSRRNHVVLQAGSCHSGKEASQWPPRWQGEAWKRRVPARRENQPAQAGRCRRSCSDASCTPLSPRPRQAAPQLCPVANGNNPEPAALGARLRRLGTDSPARSRSDWAGVGGGWEPPPFLSVLD